MTSKTTQHAENLSGVIKLDASLNIADVATLRETLNCYATTGQDIVLDGSLVESIDTVSLQLLLAFTLQIQSNGSTVTWQEPSTAISNIAQTLGLEDKLDLDCISN